MAAIQSESRFVWKLIFQILITPFTLILLLFGKRKLGDLFRPFTDIIKFLFEAKFAIAMITVNVTVYFISLYLSKDVINSLIHYPINIFSVKAYTLITSGFLHANLSHLVLNMVGIFIFSRVVERKLGIGKTALVYFCALIISNVFSSVIHIFILGTNVGAVGASGALMGLVATAILIDPFYITHELIMPLPVMVVGWLTIYADISGILNPVEDGIGHFAHLGGFISIAIIMYLLGVEDRKKLKKGFIMNIVSLLLLVLAYFYLIPYIKILF